MRLENLGLIGNCQFSALVSRTDEVVWCCLPRFDSEPVFSTLLDKQNGGDSRSARPIAPKVRNVTSTTPTYSKQLSALRAGRFM
jgi:GH15 family glucan-1,4-alpha-glucosidase